MREEETSALLTRDVAALVADCPIDASIRPKPKAVHVVAGIGDVSAKAGCDDFLHVRHAVAIRILEAPDVGDRGQVDPAIEIKDAGGDARNRRVEAFGEDGDLVGDAVAIGVSELVDPFLVEGEILPVDRTVLVMVLKATPRRLHLPGGEFALVEGKFLRGRREADVIRNPCPVLTDIEVTDLAPGGRGDVGITRFVERHRSRIGYVKLTRPLERLHLCAVYGD